MDKMRSKRMEIVKNYYAKKSKKKDKKGDKGDDKAYDHQDSTISRSKKKSDK